MRGDDGSMSVTAPRQEGQGGSAAPQGPPRHQAPPVPAQPESASAPLPAPRYRRSGATFGPFPVVNLVVFEVGVAVGLVLIALGGSDPTLYIGADVAVLALVVALLRIERRWLTQWVGLTVRYAARAHTARVTPAAQPDGAQDAGTASVPESGDVRVGLLRLVVPDLVLAGGVDHDHNPVGFAHHDGAWTAALLVDPAPAVIAPTTGMSNLPLGALAPCLSDRGVVLDAVNVIWHCYPCSAALPPNSPALDAYLELLGPLPAAARRSTWVALRLDPRRCPDAIDERGGGVQGAHRALLGALSRTRSALAEHGVRSRPLRADELLRAGTSAAELSAGSGAAGEVALTERWNGVTAAGVEHACYAVTGWSSGDAAGSLGALTGVRALSSTLSLCMSPGNVPDMVGLRGLVRLSARSQAELAESSGELLETAERLGVSLTALNGLQRAALAASLPLGGAA
jgi:type VII secretion protein EccE